MRRVSTSSHGTRTPVGKRPYAAAHDDAVGTHAQAISDQIALVELPFALDVGGPGFQPHHMVLLQLEISGILNGDNRFTVRSKTR